MEKKEVMSMVLAALEEIKTGHEFPETVDENTTPIGDLPGFDSLSGLEFTNLIAKKSPFSTNESLCVSPDGNRALTIREIVDRIHAGLSEQRQGD